MRNGVIWASVEPGLDECPDTGSGRGVVVIKCRFYEQISDKNVIGRWRVPHCDAVMELEKKGIRIFLYQKLFSGKSSHTRKKFRRIFRSKFFTTGLCNITTGLHQCMYGASRVPQERKYLSTPAPYFSFWFSMPENR